MPMYEGPVIPVEPSLHGWEWAHSMISPLSWFSRAPNAFHFPRDEPVPRASTMTFT